MGTEATFRILKGSFLNKLCLIHIIFKILTRFWYCSGWIQLLMQFQERFRAPFSVVNEANLLHITSLLLDWWVWIEFRVVLTFKFGSVANTCKSKAGLHCMLGNTLNKGLWTPNHLYYYIKNQYIIRNNWATITSNSARYQVSKWRVPDGFSSIKSLFDDWCPKQFNQPAWGQFKVISWLQVWVDKKNQ